MPRYWSLRFLVSPCYLQDAMPWQWSSSDLPRVLRIWESVFYLTLLTPGFKASLGAGISTSNLTGLHADLWNIVRSDYSLEWQQSTKEAYWQVLFKVTVGRLMKNLPLTASNSFHNRWACQKLHGLSVRPHSHTVPHRLKVQCLCFKKSYRKYWLVPMVLL